MHTDGHGFFGHNCWYRTGFDARLAVPNSSVFWYASGELQADGVIYLRADKTGVLKPYVGQSESWTRYLPRQVEHSYDFPDADFDFHVL